MWANPQETEILIGKLLFLCTAPSLSLILNIAWKVSKYGVISVPYFPIYSPNIGKYGPEITPHLDTFPMQLVSWCSQKRMKNERYNLFFMKPLELRERDSLKFKCVI